MGHADEDAEALVHAALMSGDPAEYANLVGRLSSPRLSPVEARQLLAACARRASAVSEERHTELLAAALRVRWADDVGVAEAYTLLAQDLIARSAAFVEPFLASVIGAFASAVAPLPDDVADVAHAMLRSVLFTCPLAARALCDLIHARFPHRRLPTAVHTHYLRHVLRVLSYEPYVQPVLLPHILQQILAIDAEANVPAPAPPSAGPPHAHADEDDAEAEEETVFQMDDMAPLAAPVGGRARAAPPAHPPAPHEPHAENAPAVDGEVAKLDALLALLFGFWHGALGGGSPPPAAAAARTAAGAAAAAAAGAGGALAEAHGAPTAAGCGAGVPPPSQPLEPPQHPGASGGGLGGVRRGAGSERGSRGGRGGAGGEMLLCGLLSAFDAFVVRAHGVQCAHFALLVGTAYRPEHASALLAYLQSKLSAGSGEPFAVRQACVGYCASYGCSAAFLGAEGVHACVSMLCAYGHSLATLLSQQQQQAQGGQLLSPGGGGAQAASLLAAQRGLVGAACGCALVLERRWPLWAAAYLRGGAAGTRAAADGEGGRAGGAQRGEAEEEGGGEGGALLLAVRALLLLDPPLLLGAMHPLTAAFAAEHILQQRAGAAEQPYAAAAGHSRAAHAAAAGLSLPFEGYPSAQMAQSAPFVRPLLLLHGTQPPHAEGDKARSAGDRPLALGEGVGLRRWAAGSEEEGADGADGSCSHSLLSAGTAAAASQPRSLGCSLHEEEGALRLAGCAALRPAARSDGLSPLRMEASPTGSPCQPQPQPRPPGQAAAVSAAAGCAACALLPAHNGLPAAGGYGCGGYCSYGYGGYGCSSAAIPLSVQLGPSEPLPFGQQPLLGRSAQLEAPVDGCSLAGSLPIGSPLSMSCSPDDLESHIRQRFEECKRVAVREGNISPGSSPPASAYGGFDGMPRLAAMYQ